MKEEPCCKFMLKHDIKNCFRQFTNTFQLNTTDTDLVVCNYIWLEQLNICAKYGILSDILFSLLDKLCKIYKVI